MITPRSRHTTLVSHVELLTIEYPVSDSLHHLKSCERCGRLGCDQTLGEDNETSQKLCYVCLGKVLSKAGRKRGILHNLLFQILLDVLALNDAHCQELHKC